MSYDLIVAEKPSLAQNIAEGIGNAKRLAGGTGWEASYRGTQFRIVPLRGHVLEQRMPEEVDAHMFKWSLDTLPYTLSAWTKRPKALRDKNTKRVLLDKDKEIKLDPDALAMIRNVKDHLKGARRVVNAGDPDREGSLLVDELLQYLNCSVDVQRIWLKGQDAFNVQKAMEEMRPAAEYQGYVDAAEARSRIDLLIGVNFVRGFTCAFQRLGNEGTLHIGRVQTPTLWMVYCRDQEIANFKAVDHYSLNFEFAHANGTFAVKWEPHKGAPGVDDEGRMLDKARADQVLRELQGQIGDVVSIEVDNKSVSPPLPFNLSELSKAADKMWHYSPEEVLEAAQALYDAKLTTYPRTSCQYLSESMHAQSAEIIAAVQANMRDKFRYDTSILNLAQKSAAWNDAKREGHEGMTPTLQRGDIGSLPEIQQRIYGLITRNFLAQFAPSHQYVSTSVRIEAGGSKVDVQSLPYRERFSATGKRVTQLGWKKLFGEGGSGEGGTRDDTILPAVAEGDEGLLNSGALNALRTKPPSHYTQAELLDAMLHADKFVLDPELKSMLKSSKGIGTDATRAETIRMLILRGYLEEVAASGKVVAAKKRKKGTEDAAKRDKTIVRCSDKGRMLIGLLPDEIRCPDLTALLEEQLFDIEQGRLGIDKFIKRQFKLISGIVEAIKSGELLVNMPRGSGPDRGSGENDAQAADYACPECAEPLLRRQNRSKPGQFFWVCANSHFQDDRDGVPVPRAPREPRVERATPCPDCGAQLIKRNGSKGPFWACSAYPKCRRTEEIDPTE